ncbi:hypothetical protein LINGRAHAP2_LOCUS8870 [Linum grandiflorum]
MQLGKVSDLLRTGDAIGEELIQDEPAV